MKCFSILLLLLVVKLSACEHENATTNSSADTIGGRGVSRIRPIRRNRKTAKPVMLDSKGKTICENWDQSGSVDTGELCEEDFQYDEFSCLIITEKLKRHKGKREFGEKCDASGGEDACLLLSPITDWRWKDFTEPTLNLEIGSCGQRTNLICHGHFKKCVCGKQSIPGEFYQYDKDQKICLIRPGFPCVQEFDCSKGTFCPEVHTDTADDRLDERACHCDLSLDFREDRYVVLNTTHWDQWYCTYPELLPIKPVTKRKVSFRFNPNNSNTIVGNLIIQVFSFTSLAFRPFTII